MSTMPPLISTLLISWLFMAFAMGLLWWKQTKTLNANAVDVAWSLGFSACAIIGLFTLSNTSPHWRKMLITILVCAWSLRLGLYLLKTRVLSGKAEDGRYHRLRTQNQWGQTAFFIMYQFQALLVVGLSISIFTAMQQTQSELSLWDAIAIFIWFIAVSGESLADRQLNRFLSSPANKGKTCQVGLWKYSRHPNYFFEWLHWWTYVLFAVGSSNFILSLVGPVLMLWFLVKVTGIPATERQALRSRPDYAEYQKRTSAFIPWFRRAH